MTRASDLAKLIGAGATINDGTTITTADNDPQLTLISTDADANEGPVIDLQRNSASPAMSDLLGIIQFKGEDTMSASETYADITGKIGDPTHTLEDGVLRFRTMLSGTLTDGMYISGTTISLGGTSSVDSYLRFDGSSGDTYLHYNANDMIDVYTGGDIAMRIKDDDVEFNGAIKSGSTEVVSSSGQILHGHHGYATRIKVLPFDFIPNDDSNTDTDGIVSVDGEANVGKVHVTNANIETHANYDIPRGYKVTHCMLYGSDSGNVVKIYEANINDDDGVEKGSGNVGTEIDCTDFDASSTNYIVIKWSPTSVDDYLYGGYITIATI